MEGCEPPLMGTGYFLRSSQLGRAGGCHWLPPVTVKVLTILRCPQAATRDCVCLCGSMAGLDRRPLEGAGPHSASGGFKRWAGMVVHVYNPNTQEIGGRGL